MIGSAAGGRMERVDERIARPAVKAGYRVMRCGADRKPDRADRGGAKNAVHVVRIVAVEQHEEAAVLVAQATVKLHREPMRLAALAKIVVDRDSLAGVEPVRDHVNPRPEPAAERTLHLAP